MKGKIGIFAAMFLICTFCIAIAEPTAAAKTKMIDKGSFKGTDPDMGYYKFSWVTYQKGTSYIKVKAWMYMGALDYSLKYTFVIQKISKTKIRMTTYFNGKKIDTNYGYTKLTAARFYWREFRPGLLSI